MEDIKLEIPKIPDDSNPIKLPVRNGDQLFIVGANGSGKSTLIQRFVKEKSQDGYNRVKWIAAHRQTWFNSGSSGFTPERRQHMRRRC